MARFFRVVKVIERKGPAVVVIQVLDQNGAPMDHQATIRYWPGAEELTIPFGVVAGAARGMWGTPTGAEKWDLRWGAAITLPHRGRVSQRYGWPILRFPATWPTNWA